MADNSRPVAEPLQKSAQAAQAVRGAVKTGKAIAGAAKGAAAGGVWGAVAGFAWENRKFVGKVIIAATAVLMIPILILCMLPGIIFGGFGNSHSPADPDTPIMNSSAAIDSNLVEISTAVSCVLSEALTDTLTAIENDYAACTADGKEVINPYESSPNFNANLFVGQYCAAKNEDYAAVSVSDMESMLRSGKDKLYSYTKKEEERTVETVTTSVFIIAPLKGHEFLRACRNTGGEFIQISPASKNCINVMEIRKTDRSVDELLDGAPIEKSELAAKIQQLHIFFSLLIPDITHEERQLLDEALIKTYNAKGITHDNDTLKDPDNPDRYREMPILGDLYDILLIAPETKRLANILNRLVHGSASTFNQRTNVNLDNKYTVLDISELSGDLLTAGMFVALDYVWDKAKQNRTVEKTIFIDECWALIGGSANRLAANFVLEIAKIIRGYGGSAVFATQDLNDFFALDDGKYGKGIINNCKTKIVLNLEDEEAQRVQSILHLSEAEVMEITHFERGNGLISTNNNNITVEFRCSDLEKSLITTDRRELQELVEQKKR